MTGLHVQAVVLAAGSVTDLRVVGLLAVGLVAGLVLLGRGFAGYRTAGRVTGTAPSRIAALAAGEVLVTGAAEAIELTLVSPLQSEPCFYYRSRVTDAGEGAGVIFHEERAVGFRVRDATGVVRVFPAEARFAVPNRYDERTTMLDGFPIGLRLRSGSAFGPGPDHDAQVADLLTVHGARTADATGSPASDLWLLDRSPGLTSGISTMAVESRERRYEEARIEPGDVVTVLGRALPFGDLADPGAADPLEPGTATTDDPEIAADLAAAQANGSLAPTPAAAWGNAAIEGFGIGRPVRPPHLDPGANALPTGDAALAKRAHEAFDVPSDALVLASAPDAPLAISLGAPAAVAAREEQRFFVGLLGAVLSIGCAVALALLLSGSAR